MRLQYILFCFFTVVTFGFYAQDMETYTDGWEGTIHNSRIFSLNIEIENFGEENASLTISNAENTTSYPIQQIEKDEINAVFGGDLLFEGVLSETGSEVNGFIKSGLLLYHVKLLKSTTNSFVGTWNLLMVDELKSPRFYLSVENGSKDNYEAYPIFGDDRFTGTWCDNFQKENEQISFTDFKTGLQFKGKLLSEKIQLEMYAGDFLITQLVLKRSEVDWEIGGFSSSNEAFELQLSEMELLISNKSLPNTHSVLISRKGELIYEKYFDGYQVNLPHDMRSASKSISSAIVGIAKDNALFSNVEQSIFDFLPEKYLVYKDSMKSKIDIQSLLTMSSGLDAIDYGINANPKSPAVEDNYQRTKDWTETILNSPMIHAPNTKANYGSANPYLLGIAVDSMVTEPLELFMDEKLFQKLEITNYIIQTDLKGSPYFGGGMYLTPRDMLKFGELYLNKGKHGKKRVLSKKWIKASLKNYRVLENTKDKNGYGYLWWHGSYQVGKKTIETLEARGAGGQYIFVVPSLNIVAVITSGNFQNGKTQQPEAIFQKYILPHL